MGMVGSSCCLMARRNSGLLCYQPCWLWLAFLGYLSKARKTGNGHVKMIAASIHTEVTDWLVWKPDRYYMCPFPTHALKGDHVQDIMFIPSLQHGWGTTPSPLKKNKPQQNHAHSGTQCATQIIGVRCWIMFKRFSLPDLQDPIAFYLSTARYDNVRHLGTE